MTRAAFLPLVVLAIASPAAARPPPIPRLEIRVGGCKARCGNAGDSVQRFVEACAQGDPAEGAARFLDTTRLVVDGDPLGRRWAGMWLEQRTATRDDEIQATARGLCAWSTGLTPPQVASILASGIRMTRSWSTEAAAEFTPPAAPPWRIVLKPRGLEWLIVEVDRRRDQDYNRSTARPVGRSFLAPR